MHEQIMVDNIGTVDCPRDQCMNGYGTAVLEERCECWDDPKGVIAHQCLNASGNETSELGYNSLVPPLIERSRYPEMLLGEGPCFENDKNIEPNMLFTSMSTLMLCLVSLWSLVRCLSACSRFLYGETYFGSLVVNMFDNFRWTFWRLKFRGRSKETKVTRNFNSRQYYMIQIWPNSDHNYLSIFLSVFLYVEKNLC